MAAGDVTKCERRHSGDARIAGELIDQPPVDQRQRFRLQIDRRHHELRLAAGRADQQVEIIGGLRRGLPQRPLLCAYGDTDRHCQRDQRHDRSRRPAQRPQIGDDHRQRVHAATFS
jgi:hypothetical protein